jgi:hypothetical protein
LRRPMSSCGIRGFGKARLGSSRRCCGLPEHAAVVRGFSRLRRRRRVSGVLKVAVSRAPKARRWAPVGVWKAKVREKQQQEQLQILRLRGPRVARPASLRMTTR